MNKVLKWILIICTGSILLYLAASFFAVFMLTYFSSSKRINHPEEERIFERIKKDYHIETIERSPEFERQVKNQDTLTYTLYLYSKKNCNIEPDSMKKNALGIAKEINNIHLESKYYKYRLVFSCKAYNPNGFDFEFLRKDLIP
ncbi:hypothetical protein [Chryseobacterium artocarpi]|uniref:hypothetical protein n=1 Tax=Chryseobacterium artocarpi TaxID=1414727 RepID=UPI003F4007A4